MGHRKRGGATEEGALEAKVRTPRLHCGPARQGALVRVDPALGPCQASSLITLSIRLPKTAFSKFQTRLFIIT